MRTVTAWLCCVRAFVSILPQNVCPYTRGFGLHRGAKSGGGVNKKQEHRRTSGHRLRGKFGTTGRCASVARAIVSIEWSNLTNRTVHTHTSRYHRATVTEVKRRRGQRNACRRAATWMRSFPALWLASAHTHTYTHKHSHKHRARC